MTAKSLEVTEGMQKVVRLSSKGTSKVEEREEFKVVRSREIYVPHIKAQCVIFVLLKVVINLYTRSYIYKHKTTSNW